MRAYLPESDLKLRGIYELYSRNIFWGVFVGDGFVGLRHKFGWCIDKEYLGDTVQGALRFICDLPQEIDTYVSQSSKDHDWIANGYSIGNLLLMGYLLRIQETEGLTS